MRPLQVIVTADGECIGPFHDSATLQSFAAEYLTGAWRAMDVYTPTVLAHADSGYVTLRERVSELLRSAELNLECLEPETVRAIERVRALVGVK